MRQGAWTICKDNWSWFAPEITPPLHSCCATRQGGGATVRGKNEAAATILVSIAAREAIGGGARKSIEIASVSSRSSSQPLTSASATPTSPGKAPWDFLSNLDHVSFLSIRSAALRPPAARVHNPWRAQPPCPAEDRQAAQHDRCCCESQDRRDCRPD